MGGSKSGGEKLKSMGERVISDDGRVVSGDCLGVSLCLCKFKSLKLLYADYKFLHTRMGCLVV